MLRENSTLKREVKDILTADIVLSIAFTLAILHGFFGFNSKFPYRFAYFFPIMFIVVTLSFVLHEMMHKFVAQHYGAIAGFRTSMNGLIITLGSSFFGFLLGIPGATVIFAHNFTKKENGLVSLAGPLTNFVVFAAFLTLSVIIGNGMGTYIGTLLEYGMFISILLAFFNMLPIMPLDGSKVLMWDKRVYIATEGVIFVLLAITVGLALTFEYLFIMVMIALLFSVFYRGIL
jgi:Peptidase family M50.